MRVQAGTGTLGDQLTYLGNLDATKSLPARSNLDSLLSLLLAEEYLVECSMWIEYVRFV